MENDEKGFYTPFVDDKICISCGKCLKICPQINKIVVKNIPKVLACWQKNDTIRVQSTSGGVFTSLATNVLNHGGTVFGVSFENDYIVKHIEVTKTEEIHKLRGSKYVQSYIGDTYREIEKRLKDGKKVLFSGTPCQVAGLNNYLNKKYDNLITGDIVCHGVPSPKFFKRYIQDITNNYSKKIKNISFRYKSPSWSKFSMKIDFDDGSTYKKDKYKDTYLVAFLYDYITRECCHDCKYTSENRVSDITLADFWGYVSEKMKYRNNEKGISLLLLNSDMGEKLFKNVEDEFITVQKTLSEAKEGNVCLNKPYKANKNRDDFWEIFLNATNGYEKVQEKHLYKRSVDKKNKLSTTINDYMYIMPKPLRKTYAKAKGKIKRG